MTDPRHHQTPPDPDDLFAFAEHNTAPRNDLEATLRRVQRATGSQGSRTEGIPTDLKTQIWEELMSTNASSLPTTQPGQAGLRRAAELAPPVSRPRPQMPAGTTPHRSHHDTRPAPFTATGWHAFANVALAAVLVLAVAAGIWRATGGWTPGGNDPGTIPFGALVNQEGTPDAPSIDPALLPKAEDCTIEPLTVDEVIWYINDPYEATYGTSPDTVVLPTEIVPASPPATHPTQFEGRNPDAKTLAAVADTFHMRESCMLADNYFAYWATMDPYTVHEYFLHSLSILAGEEDLRDALTNLQENGPITEVSKDNEDVDSSKIEFYTFEIVAYGSTSGQIRVPDETVDNAWQSFENEVSVSYGLFTADGTLIAPARSIFENDQGTPISTEIDPIGRPTSIEVGNCKTLVFVYNQARDVWLYKSGGGCG